MNCRSIIYDEIQGEASGSYSTSTTSGVEKEKRSKVWLYFQKIKNLDGSGVSPHGDCVKYTEYSKTIKTKQEPLI